MTVKQIIEEWLAAHLDYDGLCNTDFEYGCWGEDLMDCTNCGNVIGCKPGHCEYDDDPDSDSHGEIIIVPGPREGV